MSGSQLIPTNTFATQSGNIALSLLDTNFSQVASFLNNPNNYTNYLVDSGGANAYVVTFPTGVIPSSYTAGLAVVMKVANANTGASTLNVNSLGAKNILNPDASSLSSGQLVANSLVMVVYDGTQFILLGGSATSTSTQSYNGFKNRIINGAMVVNQRATTLTDYGYATDRWSYNPAVASKASVAQSSTAPAGFNNSLLVTSSAATTVGATDVYIIEQKIEGYNIADLGFGAAGASSIAISFWVRSSLTGTFGGALGNAGPDRSYPFTYTISSANTWEQKSITIAGDTTGTWATTNGSGFRVIFSLGCGSSRSGTAGAWTGTSNIFSATGATSVVGTNGATFYITGVQLEKGSTATSFDYRPYGTELQLCYRYYQRQVAETASATFITGVVASSVSNGNGGYQLMSPMRTSPTLDNSAVGTFSYSDGVSAYTVTVISLATSQTNTRMAAINFTVASGLTAGRTYRIEANSSTTAYLGFSAEL
jgi:hypothetical protein